MSLRTGLARVWSDTRGLRYREVLGGRQHSLAGRTGGPRALRLLVQGLALASRVMCSPWVINKTRMRIWEISLQCPGVELEFLEAALCSR